VKRTAWAASGIRKLEEPPNNALEPSADVHHY